MSIQEINSDIRTEFSERTETLPNPSESIAKGEAIEMASEASMDDVQVRQSEHILTPPPTNVMPAFETQPSLILDEPEMKEPIAVQSDNLNDVVSGIFEEESVNSSMLESGAIHTEAEQMRETTHAIGDTDSNITLKGASGVRPADDISPLALKQKQDITFQSLMGILRDSLIQYKKAPFLQFRLFLLAFLLAGLLLLPGIISGFLWGFYLALTLFLYIFVSESEQSSETDRVKEDKLKNEIEKESEIIDDVKGDKIYRGWMNLLNDRYNPRTFHVNVLETVTVRLQGHMLHIEHHEKAVMRNVFYEDPTLTKPEPEIVKEDIYDLSEAKIKLRPHRLSKRRWFSRKYPIMIKLAFDPIHESKGRDNVESDTEIRNDQKNLSSKESEPLLEDITVDRAHGTKEAPLFSEDRRTIGDIREARKIAEGSESESEDELPYALQSSESEDVLNATKSKPLKRKSSRVVWLFARSSREKEQWFHRLRKACKEYLCPTENEKGQTSVIMPSIDKIKESREFYLYMLQDVEFRNQLDSIMNEAIIRSDKKWEKTIFMDLGRYKWLHPKTDTSAEFIAVINLLASRIFYDFARDEYWLGLVRKKVQTKIGAVHLPYFVEQLQLVKFDLGTAIPKILKVYRPIVDQWGTWIDFDMKYEGSIHLTIETQVDLKRLTDQNEYFTEPPPGTASYFGIPVKNPALAVPDTHYSDEELPLSPEDEPDDEDFGSKIREKERIQKEKKKPGRKIMQIMDKITHSDIFKGASEIKIVRKALEEISDTRLFLNVEITQLEGTMTANFPHPPSDRLWYGFRETPKLTIKSTPQIGDKTIAFSAISNWIESKIVDLFERFLVYPNLDDLVIPLFSGNELLKGTFTQ